MSRQDDLPINTVLHEETREPASQGDATEREYRRVRIVTDAQGLPHVYVLGTDIELASVQSARVDLQIGSVPMAHLEILEPEVEIKPRVFGEEVQS